MKRRALLAGAAILPLAACSETANKPAAAAPLSPDAAATAARAAEIAFAATMAARDFDAFAGHIADDAVFINGTEPLRGKPAILAYWKRFYDGAEAPLAWAPEIVEASGDGGIAWSEGPVTFPDGTSTMRYQSVWRRDRDSVWRVVFDQGHAVCARPAG